MAEEEDKGEKLEESPKENTKEEPSLAEAPQEEDTAVVSIDAGKATAIVRQYLEDNYGNVGMLLYRVESVKPNSEKDKFIVLCSILSSIGSAKRLYHQIKVNIKDGSMENILQGEKDAEGKIILNKTDVSEE